MSLGKEPKKIYVEITSEMADATFNFVNRLFEEDLEAFWDSVCAVDQARIYGIYRTILDKENLSFRQYSYSRFIKNEFVNLLRLKMKNYKENPGIATHLRFSKDGVPMVYLLQNTIVPRHYIAESEEMVYPIFLGLDTVYKEGEIVAEWKVRLYDDESHSKIMNQNF
ncbi:hypothetical protein [Exiguobacterium sp. B2(2022)]|uniref:hypothetical protein n=1 Tax=Exiguobacterium sp. B2(2022) TaxID=2992755 RepID=UPI00237B1E90|nr:hypothetical protein [Exiguobacterium sp. B2(2022)]MDE0563364.1 hypothetical protein [Exiguobacterium sp. B2(2022)]